MSDKAVVGSNGKFTYTAICNKLPHFKLII